MLLINGFCVRSESDGASQLVSTHEVDVLEVEVQEDLGDVAVLCGPSELVIRSQEVPLQQVCVSGVPEWLPCTKQYRNQLKNELIMHLSSHSLVHLSCKTEQPRPKTVEERIIPR